MTGNMVFLGLSVVPTEIREMSGVVASPAYYFMMTASNVDPALQKRVCEFFDYVDNDLYNLDAQEILDELNIALRNDILHRAAHSAAHLPALMLTCGLRHSNGGAHLRKCGIKAIFSGEKKRHVS